MIDDERRQEHPAALDCSDLVHETRRRTLGIGRRRCRRQLDDVVHVAALDGQRVREREHVEHDRDQQPHRREQVATADPDQQDAGDTLEDPEREDDPVGDRCRDAGREVRVLRLLAAHRADDREGECRPEGHDRPEDVQEQDVREQPRQIHEPSSLPARL